MIFQAVHGLDLAFIGILHLGCPSNKMRAPRIDQVSQIISIPDPVLAPWPRQVVFITPKSDLVLRCDSETDEMIISRSSKSRKTWQGNVLISGSFSVLWTWLFVNHQGYKDGFRIALLANNVERVFDFVAVCSSIEIREALEIRAGSGSRSHERQSIGKRARTSSRSSESKNDRRYPSPSRFLASK